MIRALAVLAGSIVLAGCFGYTGKSVPPDQTRSLTVFAAASLEPPFDRMRKPFQIRYSPTLVFSYAGSQTLASQLTQGAQADIFASADTAHMAVVENAGLIGPAPRIFAHNSLAIAVARGNPKGIHALSDLARPGLVIVLADPSVPAGKYAQQVLAKAHVTVRPASLEPQVTGVVSKIALGEADAGIVYASDIKTNPRVAGVTIPPDQNVIANYAIAALKNAHDPDGANNFISFVLSPDGQSILEQSGFDSA